MASIPATDLSHATSLCAVFVPQSSKHVEDGHSPGVGAVVARGVPSLHDLGQGEAATADSTCTHLKTERL